MHQAPVGHHCPVCVGESRRQLRRGFRLPRPRSLTMVLLAAIIAVFLLELALGAVRNLRVLVDMGALVPTLVAEGQWWRLLSAMFLHADPFHLLLNAYALYLFGSLVESSLGTSRFAAIYFVTGLAAGATSFAFGDAVRVAVGASGAIFGLLGTWLAYNWRRRQLRAAQANVRLALFLIAINVVFGFSVAGIDNAAHLGGLGAGVLAGLAAEGVGRRGLRTASRTIGLALIAVAAVAVVAWRSAAL